MVQRMVLCHDWTVTPNARWVRRDGRGLLLRLRATSAAFPAAHTADLLQQLPAGLVRMSSAPRRMSFLRAAGVSGKFVYVRFMGGRAAGLGRLTAARYACLARSTCCHSDPTAQCRHLFSVACVCVGVCVCRLCLRDNVRSRRSPLLLLPLKPSKRPPPRVVRV